MFMPLTKTFQVYEKSILKIESNKAKFQTNVHVLPTKDESLMMTRMYAVKFRR